MSSALEGKFQSFPSDSKNFGESWFPSISHPLVILELAGLFQRGVLSFWAHVYRPWGNERQLKLLGCLLLADFWVLWMECNKRIFEVYEEVIEGLWD